ncbi:shiftless antiviral inhibitor of ribosomal frameshifting protein isoform X3 [Rhineura floridana]|uniref:shiftless antiviral inhibitor of ribosomal frameshifting protein isoform X3 n=1 Tax=Rhineura floridana TaxID=261503 RepID=UPI002AC86BC4|nr:shiftless antiviral inhibitor of ribosomal frameshifting protein isoform X3 [Rhineura floridana]
MHRARQDEVELEKSVRRLREKFYGIVSIKTATVLMRKFFNNHHLVCNYIILCKNELEDTDPEDGDSLADDPVALKVVDKLEKEEEEEKQKPNGKNDEKIKEVAQQLKLLPLTQKNLHMFDNAQKNCIPTEDRQFSCQPCDSMWWRRVPERKQVSRCHLCGNHYDPVPENKMWGIAEFHCTSCGRTFRGSAQMGTPSPCYSCHSPVLPRFIIPPRKPQGPRSRQQHSCFAEDCYNRRALFQYRSKWWPEVEEGEEIHCQIETLEAGSLERSSHTRNSLCASPKPYQEWLAQSDLPKPRARQHWLHCGHLLESRQPGIL